VIAVINLPDEPATSALAARLAVIARAGDVIALNGDLGAGKTAFARAFIRARGDAGEEVPSPTFTLVQIYEGAGPAIWHFDLYRLTRADEAWELGVEEAFASGISLIEWPDRLGPLLPRGRLDISFDFGEQSEARRASIDGDAEWDVRLRDIIANA
jgi:tRNA threonylcarbamoyladenosine biosynthesis protein TsaE